MEKLDLHKVYKNFYQRWYREKDNEELTRIKELIRELVGDLYRQSFNKSITNDEMLQAIDVASRIEKLETEMSRFSTKFSKNLVNSLMEQNFEIKIPSHKISRWLEKENYYGNMYVLTSERRPKQSKLGVTNLHIDDRIKKYSHRHGYAVKLFFLRKDVLQPYMHEQRIGKKYLEFRHSGNAEGDSSEWYFLSPEILREELMKIKN